MKIFFSLLLLANIGFGLMQWFLPYEQLFVETPKIEVSERLVLLSEAKESAAVDSKNSTPETSNQLSSEISANQPVCYTVGPFKDKTRALEISGRYSADKIKTRLKSSKEKEYMGVMVYLSGYKTRKQALITAEELAAKGIRDYIIVNEPDKANVLSLGVFGLKKNAERLSDKLRQMNYAVQTEARYRDRTIYWLNYQRSNESEMKLLIDQRDVSDGVSQIYSQCG